MKNEIRITIQADGSVEVDTTRVQGSVEEVQKILEDLTGRLGPVTKERHVPGHHHHHEGLRGKIVGGQGYEGNAVRTLLVNYRYHPPVAP